MSQVPFSAHGPHSEQTRSGSRHARPGGQGADQNQQDVARNQQAALDALVAAVETGQVDVPPAEADDDLSLGQDHADLPLRLIPTATGTEGAQTTGGPGGRRQGGLRYTDVPLSETIAEADAREAWDTAESCAAGFLPRDVPARQVSGGPAGGFASGGALDTAEPGPVLAAFADEVTGPDGRCTGASDDELIGVLRAWQRQEAWSAARKLTVIAELIRRRPEPGCAPSARGAKEDQPAQVAPGAMPPTWEKFCGDELAAALTCSGQAAEKALSLAYDLAARLPGTARALHDGIIDAYKARIIADATRPLDQPGAVAAEALILPGVAAKTPGQLRAVVGRAVLTIDPDAARERRERAERDARVELWREEAGTAALCGRDLPPAEALAADQRITAYARDLKAAGLDGTMDQLRARAFLDLALGTSTLPGHPTSPGSGSAGSAPSGSASPEYACQAHRVFPAPETAIPPDAPTAPKAQADGKPSCTPDDGTQPPPEPGPAPASPACPWPVDAPDTPRPPETQVAGKPARDPHDGAQQTPESNPTAASPTEPGPVDAADTPGPPEIPAAGKATHDPDDGPQPIPEPAPVDPGPADAGPVDPGPADAGPQEPGHSIPAPSEPGLRYTAGAGGLAARINLTVPLATLLGLADRPGEAAGFGAIDPDLARALAESAAGNPHTTWCVTVTDQDGHPTGHGCARPARPVSRRPAPGSRRPPADPQTTTDPRETPADPQTTTGESAHPGSLAFRPEQDHGPPGGYGRWRLRVPGAPVRELTVDLGPLAVIDCDHRDRSTGYEPSDRLRHLIEVRDGECTWPPCRRAARRSDFEHAIPYEQGGPTCACNAGARCRHHHHAKQAPGWQLAQRLPGYHTWTTPSGRQYTTGPTQYPI